MRRLLAAYQTFVGHDLPNRLVSIQAYARLLVESVDSQLDDESRLLLRRIADSSHELGGQARRCFEIGKLLLESPWGPPVSLREVVEEVVASIRCRLDASKIVFHLPESDSIVPFAAALLQQVLIELVSNAVAAISPGNLGRIEVASEFSAEGGMLRVSDTGVGVAQERIESLLRPTRMGGLLLVHQAASLWRGHVRIESVVRQGTTISITTGGRP